MCAAAKLNEPAASCHNSPDFNSQNVSTQFCVRCKNYYLLGNPFAVAASVAFGHKSGGVLCAAAAGCAGVKGVKAVTTALLLLGSILEVNRLWRGGAAVRWSHCVLTLRHTIAHHLSAFHHTVTGLFRHKTD